MIFFYIIIRFFNGKVTQNIPFRFYNEVSNVEKKKIFFFFNELDSPLKGCYFNNSLKNRRHFHMSISSKTCQHCCCQSDQFLYHGNSLSHKQNKYEITTIIIINKRDHLESFSFCMYKSKGQRRREPENVVQDPTECGKSMSRVAVY